MKGVMQQCSVTVKMIIKEVIPQAEAAVDTLDPDNGYTS